MAETNSNQIGKRLLPPAVSLAAVALVGGLLWMAPPSAAVAADAAPTLAGTWKLDKDKSDNPRQKMQEAMGNSEGGQGGGRGGMRNDFSQLTIVQNGPDIKVTGESGRTLAVLPAETNASSDANSGADSNANGRYARPTPAVHWQGSQLIAEVEGRRGGKTTRTYELSADGTQLYLTTRIENPRFSQPVTYRLVYDPVKSH